MDKKTKIVCTIGPASEEVSTLVQMVEAGMNIARLNFSHGTHEEHLERFKRIRQAEEKTGHRLGILADTKGPEIRTHYMKDHQPVYLEKGQTVRIYMEERAGTAEGFSVTYANLVHDVEIGGHILIDDGLVDLKVRDIKPEAGEIITVAENSGVIADQKGVNVPGVVINLPSVTEQDKRDICFALENGVDYIAASFVRKPEDVLAIREILEEAGHMDVQIIPKIENQEGLDNLKDIMDVSDGLLVARGDLGVEIPTEMVPIMQKKMIQCCNQCGKPVITATQMLDSMQRNPRPTRAEASDVANAIYDGTDAIMLSGETAAGPYPVEAVQTMNRLAVATEKQISLSQNSLIPEYLKLNMRPSDISEAISQSVAYTARNLHIRTIVAVTESGFTARMIAKYRPNAVILALTFSKSQARKIMLSRGVEPQVIKRPKTTDDLMLVAADLTRRLGYNTPGDRILVTAGVPVGERGTTNMMKIQQIGETLARGQGIGVGLAMGHVVKAHSPEEALAKVDEQSILVLEYSDGRYTEAMEQALGVIVADGGITSHAAIVGVNSSLPVIVGADHIMEKVNDGELITLDCARGAVYEGSSL